MNLTRLPFVCLLVLFLGCEETDRRATAGL